MKLKLAYIISTAAMLSMSNAAISMSFNGGGTLSNFLNGAGTGTTAMVWGIIVDTAGDGIDGAAAQSPYDEGFSLAATGSAAPLSLTVSNGTATDDRLYIAPGFLSVNTAVTDGNAIGVNKTLSMTSMNMLNGVAFGQSYAIVWFDSLTRPTATTEGLKYGIYVPPATDISGVAAGMTTANKLPGADGTYSYGSAFLGADTAKSMSFALGVPETSTSLLGALGALALLRRRRN